MDNGGKRIVDIAPSIESLFEDFLHPNPNINKKAIFQMIAFYSKESINRLIVYLDDEDINLRRKSINALAEFENMIVARLVDIFLTNENLFTRVSCLKILVKIAARQKNSSELFSEIEVIINCAIQYEEPLIILTLVTLLRQLNILGLPYLIALCKDENLLKSKAAITAIGEINHPSVRNCLIEVSQDNSKDSLIINSAIDILNVKYPSQVD